MRKRIFLWLFPVVLLVSVMASCGAEEDIRKESPIGELRQTFSPDGSYLVEPLDIPHEKIYGEIVYENTLFYLSYEEEQAVLCRIDLDNPGPPEVKPLNMPIGQTIVRLDTDAQGILYIPTIQYDEDSKFMDMFLHRSDADGNIIGTAAIGEIFSECKLIYPGHSKTDGSGNTYIVTGDKLFVIKPDGKLAFQLTCGNHIIGLFKDAEGKVYVHYVVDFTTRYLAAIDFKAQELEFSHEVNKLKDFLGFDGNIDSSLFFANEIGAYDYDMVNQTITERINWISANIAVDGHGKLIPLFDDRMLLVKGGTSNYWGEPRTFSLIRPMTTDETAQLTSSGFGDITLGTIFPWMSLDLKQAVVDFNQQNPGSRIEVIEYDGEDAFTRLGIDIATGNSPDILILPSAASFWTYAQRGAFQDIHPYFAYEAGFDWADYQENIIKAYEMDDKLFGLPIAFHVEALVGKKSDLGDIKEWNLNEFIAFADRFPESRMFSEPTKTAVLNLLLKANGENFVGQANDDTGFDRAFLIKMLEFANRFSEEDTYIVDQTVLDRISDGDVRILPGSAFLQNVQLDSATFGEPVSYVGFPSEQGSGHLVSSYVLLAVSAKCTNNETAWGFIKHLLADEFQTNVILGYPIKKSSLEERIRSESKAEGTMGGGSGDFGHVNVEMRDAAEEEIQIFRDIINRANKVRIHDSQIDSIIKEEAGAYFSGQKTVEQVADIIENRVGIYVMEMK